MLRQGWKWIKLGEIGTINPKIIRKNIRDETEVTFLPMHCVELTFRRYLQKFNDFL